MPLELMSRGKVPLGSSISKGVSVARALALIVRYQTSVSITMHSRTLRPQGTAGQGRFEEWFIWTPR